MKKRFFILIVLDVLLILTAFYISILLKGAYFQTYFTNYADALVVFSVIWIVVSMLSGKFIFTKYSSRKISGGIVKANFITTAIVTFLIFFTRSINYSRFLVFSTIIITTLLELIIYNIWISLKKAKVLPDDVLGIVERSLKFSIPAIVQPKENIPKHKIQNIQNAILEEYSPNVFSFIKDNTNLFSETTLLVATTTPFNIQNQLSNHFNTIINLKRVNDIRRINKFFEAVNQKLPVGGSFVCVVETQEQRKSRLLRKFPPVLNWIYYFFDFLLKRIFPKFSVTKWLYFLVTRGENRVVSKAEMLGRLYSCGFYVVKEEAIDNLYYVISSKIRKPYFDMEPTYGPLIKLRRVGKGGKIIKVYKLRTMHPYSEYLQEYIYSKHNLEQGGKFKDDFRVSTIGKLLRKFWIDELPMIINLLKGDLKIVGVRPLSRHYFSLYSQELRERRIKYKPGLVPPFYVDNPKTLDEIMASEIKYFDAYDKHPVITDFKYFFVATYNIVFKRLRSN
ncbi:MAG: sugar transferase [Bacteroidales bacterium]|nr:sugar transferase [Bacteroidales bacterium]